MAESEQPPWQRQLGAMDTGSQGPGWARSLCERRGGKLTSPRAAVVQALLRADQPLTAYELIERLSAEAERQFRPPTVYRALAFLERVGLVHRLGVRRAYAACIQPEIEHNAVFLMCLECGMAREACGGGADMALARVAEREGFSAELIVQEVHGVCGACGPMAVGDWRNRRRQRPARLRCSG